LWGAAKKGFFGSSFKAYQVWFDRDGKFEEVFRHEKGTKCHLLSIPLTTPSP
jgi:hypothetical protein